MATHHATPGEIVDLASWADDLPNEKTKVIIKTDEMELARLVIPKGKEFPNHKVSGPIVDQCIQGKIELTTMGRHKNYILVNYSILCQESHIRLKVWRML